MCTARYSSLRLMSHYIEPGAIIGELETFRLNPSRCVTVQARTAVTAYELAAEHFESSFEDPAVRCHRLSSLRCAAGTVQEYTLFRNLMKQSAREGPRAHARTGTHIVPMRPRAHAPMHSHTLAHMHTHPRTHPFTCAHARMRTHQRTAQLCAYPCIHA